MAAVPAACFVTPSWALTVERSSVAAFHARQVPEPAVPQVWQHEIDGPAVVLGSTQPERDVDLAACAAAGVDVVRRRSGGGAVWLAPGEVMWIDIIVPRGGDGWSDDVHRTMIWWGQRLCAVLDDLGLPGGSVHEGGLVTSDHSRTVCFDGLGPGEVEAEGAKIVGMSQRRTRTAARLQCCWYLRHDPNDLLRLLSDPIPPSSLRRVGVIPRDIAERVPRRLVELLG